MTFVFFHGTQITDTRLIGTTEKLLNLVVTRANVLDKLAGGFDQLVFLEGRRLIVRLEVRVTVRDQTLKTSLHSFQFSPITGITGHISRSSIAVLRGNSLDFCILQYFHHVGHHVVFLQFGSRDERLSALWTAEFPPLIALVPVSVNTAAAVVVSTGNAHWILQ